MQTFILDTDMCTYWLKSNENIERKIIKRKFKNVHKTVITECGLYYGAFKSSQQDKNLSVRKELKKKIRTLHTKGEVPLYFGDIKSDLEKRGQTMDDADLLILSIVLEHDATLVTNNTEHFQRIPYLRMENWK